MRDQHRELYDGTPDEPGQQPLSQRHQRVRESRLYAACLRPGETHACEGKPGAAGMQGIRAERDRELQPGILRDREDPY